MNNENRHESSCDNEAYLSDEHEIEAYSESLIEAIQNGATLKDVNGVSNETMNDVYKLAYDFYHHGKLNDAESNKNILIWLREVEAAGIDSAIKEEHVHKDP